MVSFRVSRIRVRVRDRARVRVGLHTGGMLNVWLK